MPGPLRDHALRATWRFRAQGAAQAAAELRSPSPAVLCMRLWRNWDRIILLLLILRFFPRGQQSFSILYSLGDTRFGKYHILSTFLLPTHLHHPGFFLTVCVMTAIAQHWMLPDSGHKEKWSGLLFSLFLPKLFQDTMPLPLYMDILGLSLWGACTARLRSCHIKELQLFELWTILLLNYWINSEILCSDDGAFHSSSYSHLSYLWHIFNYSKHIS